MQSHCAGDIRRASCFAHQRRPTALLLPYVPRQLYHYVPRLVRGTYGCREQVAARSGEIAARRGAIATLVLALSLILTALPSYAITFDSKITGIKGDMLQNAEKSLSITNSTVKASGKKVELNTDQATSLVIRGIREIQDAVKPYGYYHAKATYHIKKSQDKWQVHYRVNPGPAIIVKQLNLKITKDQANFPFAAKAYHLEVGKPLNQAGYEKLKTYLATTANNLGYFNAQFTTHQLALDLADHSASVNLVFEPGPRARFGDVTFSENPLSTNFLRRYIHFNQGEHFAESKLARLQSDLSTNENFSAVEILANKQDFSNKDLLVPVKVDLTTKKAINLTAGIGYGTDTGPRSQFGWQWRRVNSLGHSLSNQYQISEFRSNYRLGYQIPGSNPATTKIELATSYNEDRSPERNIDTTRQQVDLSYSKRDPKHRLNKEYKLFYQEETYREIDKSIRARLLMPQVQWQWRDKLSTLMSPRYQMSLQLRGADEALASSTTFIQGLLSANADLQLRPGLRSLLRGKIGITEEEEFSDVPPGLRFYAGGDRSVRGYAFQALGPKEVNNKGQEVNLGGSYLLEGSFELEQHLYEKWSLAAFYDVGNAFNRWSASMKKGTGVGLRWKTLIGVVRLDVATALDEPDKPWRIHFSMGPTF